MKKIIIIAIMLLTYLYGMSDKELAKSIDLAGKERMLTQKISKEALLIFIGIDLNKNIQNLKLSSALFDKTLNGLINGDKELGLVATKNKTIQLQLLKIKKIWEPFYSRIKDIYNFNNITDKTFEYIYNNNLKILNEMNKAVLMYVKLDNKGVNKLKFANNINIAGRQRMITQRIAKDLLFYQANINTKQSLKDLKEMEELFNKSLISLLKGNKKLNIVKTTLPNIKRQLLITNEEWQKCQNLISKAIKEKENQKLTKETIFCLDNIKNEMDKAVKLYTLSLNRQKQVMKLNNLIGSFLETKNSSKHLINLAGKQRMLTQRISKLTIECKEHLRPNACNKLKKFINLYDKTLNAFVNGNKELNIKIINSSKALHKINEIQKIWEPFKKAAIKVQNSKGSDIESIKFILDNNEKLLDLSNDLVSILEKENLKNLAYIEKAQLKIVNIAGRQRMLTQKMTKEKLMILYFKMTNYQTKLKNSVILFNDSLNNLIKGSHKLGIPKVTNEKIKKQLLYVYSIWNKMKPFYVKNSLTKKELVLLLKANPILLKEMNKTVKLIEQSTDY